MLDRMKRPDRGRVRCGMAVSASAAKTIMAMITVTPTAGPRGRRGYFDASLTDGSVVIRASRQPFLDAARQLLDLGYDPAGVLSDGGLTAQIGAAAKLRVKEDRNGPRFLAWEPISRRVKALASAKAKRAARVTTAKANEPSLRPGAAAATEFPSAPMLAPSRTKRASAAGRGKVPT
jgi:hypothetical protein